MKETEACKNMEIGNLRLMCSDLGKVRILSAVRIYQGLVDHGLSELSRIFLFENGQSRKWPVFKLNSFESGLPRKWPDTKVPGPEGGHWSVFEVPSLESGWSQK